MNLLHATDARLTSGHPNNNFMPGYTVFNKVDTNLFLTTIHKISKFDLKK